MSTITQPISPETHSFTYRQHHWDSQALQLVTKTTFGSITNHLSPLCSHLLLNGYPMEQIEELAALHYHALPVYLCTCDSNKDSYQLTPCVAEFRYKNLRDKDHIFLPNFILEINPEIIKNITPTMHRLIDEHITDPICVYCSDPLLDDSFTNSHLPSYKITHDHWNIVSQTLINYSLDIYNFPEIPCPDPEFFISNSWADDIFDDLQQMFFSVVNLKLPFLQEN
jgi:hypothetical protein